MNAYEIRVMRLNETPGARLTSPAEAFTYWQSVITTMPWYIPDREICVAVTLNTRLRATGHSLVSIGTLNESLVHPRDVFRAAVALNAYGVLLMHNHPSGDPSPSEPDCRLTRRVAECAGILQISFCDHVIMGAAAEHPAWFSFKEGGLL